MQGSSPMMSPRSQASAKRLTSSRWIDSGCFFGLACSSVHAVPSVFGLDVAFDRLRCADIGFGASGVTFFGFGKTAPIQCAWQLGIEFQRRIKIADRQVPLTR